MRQQRVKLNSHLSDWVCMLSAIPLEYVLGPLLSLTLIADINRNTQTINPGSFAVNTRIWQWLHTVHSL